MSAQYNKTLNDLNKRNPTTKFDNQIERLKLDLDFITSAPKSQERARVIKRLDDYSIYSLVPYGSVQAKKDYLISILTTKINNFNERQRLENERLETERIEREKQRLERLEQQRELKEKKFIEETSNDFIDELISTPSTRAFRVNTDINGKFFKAFSDAIQSGSDIPIVLSLSREDEPPLIDNEYQFDRVFHEKVPSYASVQKTFVSILRKLFNLSGEIDEKTKEIIYDPTKYFIVKDLTSNISYVVNQNFFNNVSFGNENTVNVDELTYKNFYTTEIQNILVYISPFYQQATRSRTTGFFDHVIRHTASQELKIPSSLIDTLKSFQIYTSNIPIEEHSSINCFINALQIINPNLTITTEIQDRDISSSDIKKLVEEYKLNLIIYERNNLNKFVNDNISSYTHYSNSIIKKLLQPQDCNNEFIYVLERCQNHIVPFVKHELKFMKSFLTHHTQRITSTFCFINILNKLGYIVPIEGNIKAYKSYVLNPIVSLKDVNASHVIYPKVASLEEPTPNEPKVFNTFYGDFETNIFPIHIAANIVVSNDKAETLIKIDDERCVEMFYQQISNILFSKPSTDINIIYFHNLSYDANFILEKGFTVINLVKQGSKVFSFTLLFHRNGQSRSLIFRDSYKFLTCPLSSFSKTFNLPIIKDVCPHKAFTVFSRNTFPTLPEILSFFDVPITSRFDTHIDENEFYFNLDKSNALKEEFTTLITPYLRSDNTYDIHQYRLDYCVKDVQILAQGFELFRKACIEFCLPDPNSCMTISSLSKKYFEKFSNTIPQVSGILCHYLKPFITGGRVLTNNNIPIKVVCNENEKIIDLDENSLYPSSVYYIQETYKGFPSGDLVHLTSTTFPDIISSNLFWFAKVQITTHNKPSVLPGFCHKKDDELIWGDISNTVQYINNISYKDLLREEISFTFIEGFYFSSVSPSPLPDELLRLFNIRKTLKKSSPILAEAVKLLSNSQYGKTIQAPRNTTSRILNKNSFDDFLSKHINKVKEFHSFNNDKSVYFSEYQNVMTSINSSLLGVLILSASKQIVNNHFDILQQTPGFISFLYSDTDSLMLKVSKDFIEPPEIYNDGFGRLSSDFDKQGKNTIFGTSGIFLAKKLYQIVLNNGKVISKCKGIPERNYIYDTPKFFSYLEHGLEIKVNLTFENPKIGYQKGFQVISNQDFERIISIPKIEAITIF